MNARTPAVERRVLLPAVIRDELPVPGSRVHDFGGETMGTTWSVRLAEHLSQPRQDWQAGIQAQLDAVVAEMSHWRPDSDLGRFNQAPAGSWHELPEDFFRVLSYALSVAADSGGAYDPAAGALVNLWGFGPVNRYDQPGFIAPTPQVLDALAGEGWRRIRLEPAGRRAFQPGGVLLDLSAVAKGFAVDKVARYLERAGIRHYLVEVGGELRGAGMKPDAQPWWVELEQPPLAGGAEDGILLALHGLAVATSGDYRRSFLRDGKLHPHTLDPRSGRPVEHGVASVTVIHSECMAADALSTALTVLGVEHGLAYAEQRGLAARFLVRQGGRLVEHASSRFLEMLQ